ncbi:MAG: IS3 family transposase [Verrucomicrobiae bacterium]|nr:IS3 family transposase [Verrucomicrobiae bacterium]
MEQQQHHATAKWAKILGVSTSGYYDWKRHRDDRAARNQAKRQVVIDLFRKEGKGVYGTDRICGCMRRDGHRASYSVVKRIMTEEGLKSSHCRRRQRSLTDSRKARSDAYKNLTKGLKITRPFQVISSDISYIRTGEGFDYLCQVRDVLTNTVLAAYQSETMSADLVMQTIKMAQDRWRLSEGIIFHSDRGSQYTAKAIMTQISDYGWQQSFSRVGKPGDNSWSESFFSILKKEIIHWHFYPTRDRARQAVFEYIEVFYNRQRAQKRLGYLSPVQYLKRWQQSQLQAVA